MNELRILLIGNGGREHALAWKLSQSPRVGKIYIAPGNGGTASGLTKVENVPDLQVGDFSGLTKFAISQAIDLVIPGPEQPLVDGIVDYFRDNVRYFPIFGPTKKVARLEGSKTFAKDFMKKHNIPTAEYQNFTDFNLAARYLDTVKHEVVIKASGLAAGKGVILPNSKEEALEALKDIMLNNVFGSAGNEVVIEEKLIGQEVSILSFSDGHTMRNLSPAQDHKQIYDGDKGPNTGGMGCYAPTPVITSALMEGIQKTILQPTIDAMRRDGTPFIGCLFTGLMITKDGPKTLEYNLRFGDPETQTCLPLLSSDLAEIMLACTGGYLDAIDFNLHPGACTTVVAAAGGYPGSYNKGDPINIKPDEPGFPGTYIFHAGTEISKDNLLKTSGGRVIASTGSAATLEQSVKSAYTNLARITFSNMHYRKDIAHRALNAPAPAPPSSQPQQQTNMTYASAGVSIASGNTLVQRIRPLIQSTARPGADALIGGFGGTFDLAAAGYEHSPTLVTGTDGVGTKLMIANAINKHDTIGIDLVAMNVNDIIVQGAEPLFLTDVYSCHNLDVDVAVEVVRGICKGCVTAGCALIGGETAEMGDMFKIGDYDVTAAATGAISRGRRALPWKEDMRVGDVVLGLASSGCHSNGFSLIRKIIEKEKLSFADTAPWDSSTTIGEALLTPTRIYVKPLLQAVEKDLIKGMAHITGGGLMENVPRMLPGNLAVEFDAASWPALPILDWLRASGNVEDEEFFRVWNAGLGMVLVVGEGDVEKAVEVLEMAGEKVYRVGVLMERERHAVLITNTQWRG